MITDYSELSEATPLSKRIREIREIRNHIKIRMLQWDALNIDYGVF